MSKTTVTRLFIGSGIAIVAGAILSIAAVWLAIANDVFVMSGPDIVGIHGSALGWSLIGFGIVGADRDGRRRDRRPRVVDRRPAQHLAARQQDVVRGPAAAGDLQPRFLRDDRVPHRRARRHGVPRPEHEPGPRRGLTRLRTAPSLGPFGASGCRVGLQKELLMTDTRSMTGKTVLITGGTGGIGRAAAIGLASMGARVGITGRDRARAEEAAAAIARESGNPAVDVFVGDMSSQAEVRRLADEVLAAYPRLDVLLNNVGGFWAHRHVTADGLEHTFALNHLAPFLLTNLLLDRLIASAPARIVTVSSGAQSMGTIDFDDLMGEQTYSGSRAYNQSKLANVMFTYELAKRLEGTGVTATALHPGVTSTAFSAEDPAMGLLVKVMRPFMRSPAKGADTAVYLASSADAEGISGKYFADRKVKKSRDSSYDTAITARLWQVSADLVGLPGDRSH